MSRLVAVEVVYATANGQTVVKLSVPEGSAIREVIGRSGILARHPEINLSKNRVGVFGRLRAPDDGIRAGDRVEIYRPLMTDPKQRRRERARTRRGKDA